MYMLNTGRQYSGRQLQQHKCTGHPIKSESTAFYFSRFQKA